MRGGVLRSEAMMPKFRLPLVYFLLFFMVGFWPHKPCNYDNCYFSSMHMLSFVDEFCHMCMLCMSCVFAFVCAMLRYLW